MERSYLLLLGALSGLVSVLFHVVLWSLIELVRPAGGAAPINVEARAAMSRLDIPDILLHGSAEGFDLSAASPRLIGAAAAGIWLCFSRHIVGCLAAGMAAYTVARLLLPAGGLP